MSAHRLEPLRESQIAELTELINRSYAADSIEMIMTRQEVEDLVITPHTTPQDDARVVVANGEIAGYALVGYRPSGLDQERAHLLGTVDAPHRGKGIGSDLLRWSIERATERLQAIDNDLPRYIRSDAYDWQEDVLALFARHGLKPVRYHHEMIRPLGDSPLLVTDGFQIVGWKPELSEAARASRNTAFRDHWGSTPVDADSWQHWLDDHGTRLDLSFLALAGDEVIGVCMNANYPDDEAIHGRREGWIEGLSTVREWRRRGVATALLVRSFQAFEEAGFTHAALGVDTENPTGAARLYTDLGFVTERRSILVQLEPASGG